MKKPKKKKKRKGKKKVNPLSPRKNLRKWSEHYASIFTHATSTCPQELLLQVQESQISLQVAEERYQSALRGDIVLYVTDNHKKARAFCFLFLIQHMEQFQKFIARPDGYEFQLVNNGVIHVVDMSSPCFEMKSLTSLLSP